MNIYYFNCKKIILLNPLRKGVFFAKISTKNNKSQNVTKVEKTERYEFPLPI